ncbi:NUDIX hydrolase [Paenibacillus sp. PK3_47]|uniref:NUDIX hydrolase n=1 Tax=Paenibacillus sp. PK3_47 TaxID=2072642 RepID=UPI00201E0CC1|nr:NUDIX domain-containing protein [Paenibacillus sp. PK3_47]UQZ37265.1 NUDIX hydrolase [Paenibacillus sp. PK3_47]
MNSEILTTFDEHGNITGSAPRDEVHRLGLWHETFHCWFVAREHHSLQIYLQLRSQHKKDYAGLLDITAAGHLLESESPEDGIREVQEELGIDVAFEDLIPLGIVPYTMDKAGFMDRERAHVFLYENHAPFSQFQLQQEEVAGMVTAGFSEFRSFWLGERSDLHIQGFRVEDSGERSRIDQLVDISHFVPHEHSYYLRILEGIEEAFG